MKIAPWRLAVEDYAYTGYVAMFIIDHFLVYMHIRRVYKKYTRVGTFDTPTHQPTNIHDCTLVESGPAYWVTSFITSRSVCVYSCLQLRELWFNDVQFGHSCCYFRHGFSYSQYYCEFNTLLSIGQYILYIGYTLMLARGTTYYIHNGPYT